MPGAQWGPCSTVALVVLLQRPVSSEQNVCCHSKSGTTAVAQGHCGVSLRQGPSLKSPKSWLKGATKGGSLFMACKQ